MMRGRVYSVGGGMLLITSAAYLMLYAFDPFELGDEFRSPIGAAACVVGIAAAAGLLAASVVVRRNDKARRKGGRPNEGREG